ncbi:hypothetical protein [Arcobacter sp. FWKO B]|nr:hypothetical protein [Arcobacter sp. FWKO B]
MQTQIIQIQNLTHYYGKKKIYENLNLSIKEGSVFMIDGIVLFFMIWLI